jgi:predicted MFS family arabinose efflux permease
MAQSYAVLVAARIITGLFGGVIGSISMAIITDMFALQQRGRVMGFIQMGFGASQVLGIPIGLYLANLWSWEAPFWMVAGTEHCYSNSHCFISETHNRAPGRTARQIGI